MNIEIFTLCDAATDQGGKLNILGTFDAIAAGAAPVTHPECTIAMRLRFEQVEAGEHSLRISIIDYDGRAVVPPIDGKIAIAFPPQAIESSASNFVIKLQQLRFSNFGKYRIDLAIDGKMEKSLPLYLNQMQKPGG
jgi:hypothetical protein